MQIYYLPLLPGYGPQSNLRSSAAPTSSGSEDPSSWLSEAEEAGYQGTYFDSTPEASGIPPQDGYMSSSPPPTGGLLSPPAVLSPTTPPAGPSSAKRKQKRRKGLTSQERGNEPVNGEDYAEVIFFAYGVVVFFGLTEQQERGILEDVERAGAMRKKFGEDDWEVEECHYAVSISSRLRPYILCEHRNSDFPISTTPISLIREYITISSVRTSPVTRPRRSLCTPPAFKTHSHLLKLSVAHALAQSTLLAHYETHATRILSSPRTVSIPQQLASTGALMLPRKEALRLTGRLFTLRRDVNLVSNVLDVPELFWSEASLKALYDAVREYMEIGGRVQVLNEKLAVAEDLVRTIAFLVSASLMLDACSCKPYTTISTTMRWSALHGSSSGMSQPPRDQLVY